MGKCLKALKGKKEGSNCEGNELYRIQDVNFPAKLIEPSKGIIVELEVTEQDINIARKHMNQLVKYAESLEQYGTQWEVRCGGREITMIFLDENLAEKVRKIWRK